MIRPEWQRCLYEWIVLVAEKNKCRIEAIDGVEDHLHCLVSLSRTVAVSDLVRELKARSAKWVHDSVPEAQDFRWQEGYGVFTVSYSSLDIVKQYIQNQEMHHKASSYEVEMMRFAQKHDLAWEAE